MIEPQSREWRQLLNGDADEIGETLFEDEDRGDSLRSRKWVSIYNGRRRDLI